MNQLYGTPPTGQSVVEYAIAYTQLGWSLCEIPLGQKGPRTAEWNAPQNVVSTAEQAAAKFGLTPLNMGLVHAYSMTASIDVDHYEWTKHILATWGVDLDELLNQGMRVISREGRAKVIFRLPVWAQHLKMAKITWPAENPKHPNDRITIFELRTGLVQDVLPPSIHPDTQQPYQWMFGKTPWNYPADGAMLPVVVAEMWNRIEELRPEMENLCPWRKADVGPKRVMRYRAPETGGLDIIGKFNSACHITDMLGQAGYRLKGKRWLAPSSSTNIPGVVVFDDGPQSKCYSHHASDILNDGFAHDSFDLFVLFEHGGDLQRALNDAAQRLGLDRNARPADIVTAVDFTELVANERAKRAARLRMAVVDQATGEITAQGPARASAGPDLSVISQVSPCPLDLQKLPAMLKKYMSWTLSSAARQRAMLALAAGITLFGVVLGRKVMTSTGLRTNAMIIGVAPTGLGKDHARKTNKVLLSATKAADRMGPEELASGAGLMTLLRDHPATLVQLDEFGLYLGGVTSKQAGMHDRSVIETLMKASTSAETVMHGKARADSKANPVQDVPYPCLCVHGTTTPGTLFAAMKSEHVMSGLLNRFLVIFEPDTNPPRQYNSIGEPPEELVDWINAACEISGGPGGNLEGANPAAPIVVAHDAAAMKILSDFDDWIQVRIRQLRGTGMDSLWARAWEHASRLSLIFACLNRTAAQLKEQAEGGTLRIDFADAEFAVSFTKWLTEELAKQCEAEMHDSDFEAVSKSVAAVLDKKGAEGMTMRDITNLCRQFRSLDPQSRSKVLQGLQETEFAFSLYADKGGLVKRKSLRWFHESYREEVQAKIDASSSVSNVIPFPAADV